MIEHGLAGRRPTIDRRRRHASRGRSQTHGRTRADQDRDAPRRRARSPGVNIAPGSDDDGWIVPPPVALADGTRVQLYKDGEALHAALRGDRAARSTASASRSTSSPTTTPATRSPSCCAGRHRRACASTCIYDSFGSIGTDRELFERMRRAGVQLAGVPPAPPVGGTLSAGGRSTATIASCSSSTTTSPAWAG